MFNESDLIDPDLMDQLIEESLLCIDDENRVFGGMEVTYNESECFDS